MTSGFEHQVQSSLRAKGRAGYTIIELVVAMASASILLGGMASTIFFAGQALDADSSVSADILAAGDTLNDLAFDLQEAVDVSERTSTAVTFTVPDRDGDDTTETIRYSWSGTAGEPLLIQIDGDDSAETIDQVEQLQLDYLSRSVTGTGFAKGVIDDDDGLVAYWAFNEGVGNTAEDSTANENHGKLQNGTKWVISGNIVALQFDGSDDYVSVPHDDVLSLNNQLTITAWIQGAGRTFDGYDTIVFKGTARSTANYYLALYYGYLTFGFYDGGWMECYAPTSLSIYTTYHVAVTMEPYETGYLIRLYQNGVEVAAATSPVELPVNTQDLTIGHSPYGEYWKGYMDDVRIYNRALSGEKIVEIIDEAL